MRINTLVTSTRVRIAVGVALAALSIALVVLVVAYRRLSQSHDRLAADRSEMCRATASRLECLESLAQDQPQLDMRHQVKKMTDQFVSKICLGDWEPVSIKEANDCWVMTHEDSCYFGCVEKLLPLYRSKGW